jgi:hypothetical protein
MPLRIAKAEKADIPQLVDLYFNTFKSALVLKIKPDVPPVREWYERNMRSDIDKPHTHVYKVEEIEAGSTQPTGEIIAFAKWSSPHTDDPDGSPTKWPLEGDVALFEEVVGKAMGKKRTIMGEEEHWCKSLDATQTVSCNGPKHVFRSRRPRNLAKVPASGCCIATND